MELLIIWVLSIFFSLSMEFANGMKIFKFAADEGYKINREAMKESNNLLSPEMQKKAMFPLFIPIFNLFYAMKHTMDINNLGNNAVESLLVLGILEEMTEEEINEYKKNPSLFNATSLTMGTKERKSTSITIKEPGKEDSKIYFSLDNDNEDIQIVKATGPVSEKNLEEQKKIVIDTFSKMRDEISKQYKNWDDFENEIAKNKEINLEKTIDENTKEKLNNITSANNELENLKKLKNELEQNKDIKTLSLRKKENRK